MEVTIRIYDLKNKLIARRMGKREDWQKLHGKIASARGHKWSISVVYGFDKDVFGHRHLFKNKGDYFSAKEATRALSAFLER